VLKVLLNSNQSFRHFISLCGQFYARIVLANGGDGDLLEPIIMKFISPRCITMRSTCEVDQQTRKILTIYAYSLQFAYDEKRKRVASSRSRLSTYSGGSINFLLGAEDNCINRASSSIANAHNELYAFCPGKKRLT